MYSGVFKKNRLIHNALLQLPSIVMQWVSDHLKEECWMAATEAIKHLKYLKHRITQRSTQWIVICWYTTERNPLIVLMLVVMATLSTCQTGDKSWLWVDYLWLGWSFLLLFLEKYCIMKSVHSFWISLYMYSIYTHIHIYSIWSCGNL